jgi:hypothetical protein
MVIMAFFSVLLGSKAGVSNLLIPNISAAIFSRLYLENNLSPMDLGAKNTCGFWLLPVRAKTKLLFWLQYFGANSCLGYICICISPGGKGQSEDS